jgi:MYXO-CTERM domain-containing protein
MKNLGNGYVPVYYSEYMRNVDCTGCTMPGYWKMALSYQSTVIANGYYMAWEDWEGANATSWPDDGDFNDKVFKFTGVTCNGGGVPCNTGMQGVCSLGVTQCEGGGTIVCKPTVTASPEKCDNLDNDCNGQVDDGTGLCPGTEVCMQGTCTGACGTQEFACQPGWQCQDGLCVDPKCVGVTCEVGQICRAGTCVGGCDGVTCPLGQECQLGVCIDPCATVTCNGAVCDHGACVTVCSCQPCGAGQVCTSGGSCVDTGCDVLTCGTGQVCQAGVCIDACTGAVCPGGADCHNGVCDMPSTGQNTSGTGGVSGAAGTTGSGSGGAAGHSGTAGTTGSAHGGAGGGTTTSGTGGQTTTGGGPHEAGGEVSCSCETGGAGRGGLGLLAALFALASFRRRHRRLQGAPRA